MNEQANLFLDSSREFLSSLASFLPRLIGAILILLIGWLIARLLKRLVVGGLKLIKFGKLTEKAGIDQFLSEGGVKVTAIDVLGTLIYWMVMLLVVFGALNSLNLTAAAELFNQVILFIPNIVVGIIILIFGMYLARIVSQIILTSLKNMKDTTAHNISRITYYAILILTVFITLSQLQIAPEIVNTAFLLMFGGICLAAGLAFGLGGKEKAAEIIKDLTKKEQ